MKSNPPPFVHPIATQEAEDFVLCCVVPFWVVLCTWTDSGRPNLLPGWQPSLQLESLFQWLLLSMCSSSKSNTCAEPAQSLSLTRA